MKITKSQLKQLIKEELSETMRGVEGVDSMPPGEEFVGPPNIQIQEKTVEERLEDVEREIRILKRKLTTKVN